MMKTVGMKVGRVALIGDGDEGCSVTNGFQIAPIDGQVDIARGLPGMMLVVGFCLMGRD